MRAVVAVLLFVTAAHAALWGILQEKQQAPDFKGMLPSVSYAPFDGTAHPDIDNIPNAERIRADLKKLATMTRAIRLYSSTGGVELVPAIANEFGLKVTVGAWIDKNLDRNEREIAAAVDLAKRNSNVIAIVVGNETIYRGELKADDLIEYIRRVKRQVNVPVTTGEIWNIWRDNLAETPDGKATLASSVDFIAAHILPYWENFTAAQAVDQAVYIHGLLREVLPGKRIVIAEFGWPSAGYNLRNAIPGPFEQAVVLRNFVARAEAIGMEYNLVEAIDQPWKFFEGGVGPYWGILDASREPKFSWTGPIVNENYWKLATIALLVSGGHTSLLHVRDLTTDVEMLGETMDDAAGEAFDKVARLLSLPYPGGPEIDRAALDGDPEAIRFPRGLSRASDLAKHRYDFSFSGLKTAVARWVERCEADGVPVPVADVAASFREAVVDVLVTKALAACADLGVPRLLLGGGVIANRRLREVALERAEKAGVTVRIPPLSLCTDNGAMIAALAAELISSGRRPSTLAFGADSTLPVTEIQVDERVAVM